jgi:hypothetical protein
MGLTEIMLIIAGLVLLVGVLYLIPAIGKYLSKLAKWLGSFQTVIGIIAIIVAILNIGSLDGIWLLISGLILAVGILPMIPRCGQDTREGRKVSCGLSGAYRHNRIDTGVYLIR